MYIKENANALFISTCVHWLKEAQKKRIKPSSGSYR